MIKELTPEQILENWNKCLSLCEKLGDRAEPVQNLLEFFGDRFVCAPASTKIDHHCCYPGGLVQHTLNVIRNAFLVSKNFFPDSNISKESIILVAMLHDIGKCGSLSEDYYVPQESQWHRDKLGENFKCNHAIQYMPHAHRSIYLLQYFNVKLSEEEFVALIAHDGPYTDESKSYMFKEPVLASIIHVADLIATKQEKL